jgi:hypothetical protein
MEMAMIDDGRDGWGGDGGDDDDGGGGQSYWVSGLCPSSGIVNIRKHNVSGTVSVSILR